MSKIKVTHLNDLPFEGGDKMTTAEAINLLVNARYADEFQCNEDLCTAHQMAIDALETTEMLKSVNKNNLRVNKQKSRFIELTGERNNKLLISVEKIDFISPTKQGSLIGLTGSEDNCVGVKESYEEVKQMINPEIVFTETDETIDW